MTDSDSSSHGTDQLTRRQVIAATGATSVVALAGCSGGDGGDGSDGGDSGDGSDGGDGGGSTDGGGGEPAKPDSITVRAWGGAWQDNLDEYVAQPFTEETGIPVEYDNSTEDEMQAKIRTAVEQDRQPPINVQWSLTKTSYQSYQMDLMEPLDTEVVPSLGNLLDASQPDVDGADWPFVNLYSYTYSLTYNTDQVSSPPESWEAWWDEEWENEIGLYPSGHGITPLLGEMTDTELGPVDDMDPIWERYRDLKPNVGTIGEDAHLTQNLRQGEVSMAVMLPANIVNAQDEGAPVDYTIPEEGARAGRDTMWIPTNQDESKIYWGQKFIETAATGDNIGPWCENLGVAPLHPDAAVPDWMAEDVAFPTSEEQFNQMIVPSLDVLTEYEPKWETQVNEILET
ncbi:MAG: extracellular solute-binding protein [Haloarculaceae archaeon]